jgi:glycosyltransferase involved in cell wall biosynthesis
VIPARNEAGHLAQIVDTVSKNRFVTEILIIEGGSSDGTYEVALALSTRNPVIRVFKQSGAGKFNAVIEAARKANSKHILIWDADDTVPAQDVSKVIERYLEVQEPVMGNRLTGRMEPGAMQFLNKIGNYLFGIAWSPLLDFEIKDLLCGTKIFPIHILNDLPENYSKLDPYGDFALIGFSRLKNLKVHSVTVDYRARTYGKTNINRWRGGVQLFIFTVIVYRDYLKKKLQDGK